MKEITSSKRVLVRTADWAAGSFREREYRKQDNSCWLPNIRRCTSYRLYRNIATNYSVLPHVRTAAAVCKYV